MTIREINEVFTEKVQAYLSAGYRINSGTMSGTQGEIAKVDLTNGKIIVRVRMEEHFSIVGDSISIIVGMTEKVRADGHRHDIIWNGRLKEIGTDTFWALNNDRKWYGTEEEMRAASKKHRVRIIARSTPAYKFFGTEEAKRAVLPFLNRTKGCKSAKLKDIDRVYRDMDTGKYWVDCRGHAYCLN